MDYLGRDAAPFGEDLWQQIDEAVVSAASEILVGRRFLPFFGPVGPGLNAAEIASPEKEEVFKDGFSIMEGRELKKVPQLYEDFWLYWRDIEGSRRVGFPVDVSAAKNAAQKLAQREDQMIFYGVKELGYDGLLTVPGSNVVEKGDWNAGEEAFMSVVKGMSVLRQKSKLGKYALILSPDLYVALHRIQPSAGVVELDRVKSLVNDRVFLASILQPGTALLVCAQPQYMDFMVGQDISAAYTELVDLNHHFRILETAILRIKSPEAIVVFK
ncbi:bacteriocin [Deltaproteobacteria bacterium Smac51]|nr:bacteriocin [Deltaproteobacteria bacterium Smac51]